MSSRELHDALPTLASVCTHDGEVLALTIARLVATARATGEAAYWDTAHDGAERILGPVEGARFVAEVACLMRAVLIERDGYWRLMPPLCSRVTEDEAELVALLRMAETCESEARLQALAASLARRPRAPKIALCAQAAARALRRLRALRNPAEERSADVKTVH